MLTHHTARAEEPARSYAGAPILDEARMTALWEREAVPGSVFHAADGSEIMVHSIGRRNPHDGPDYLDALLTIDGTTMVGAVELHVDERAWKLHRHDADPRYASVVLHVALYRSGPRVTPPGIELLILSEQFLQPYRSSIRSVLSGADPFPVMLCAEHLPGLPRNAVAAMLSVAAGERFEAKRERISRRWRELKASGEPDPHIQLFHELLMRTLGYGGNQDDFEALARALPYRTMLVDGGDSALARLALLCRIGGIAPKTAAAQLPRTLGERFLAVHRALPVPTPESRGPEFHWNSSGIRPGNRVLPRLTWYAGFAHRLADRAWWSELFFRMRNPGPPGLHSYDRLIAHLHAAESLADFRPGIDRCREMCINAIAPFAAVIASDTGRPDIVASAAALYHSLAPAPENRITRQIAPLLGLGTPLRAGDQQGMLELHARYCSVLRCRECLIGKACSAAR